MTKRSAARPWIVLRSSSTPACAGMTNWLIRRDQLYLHLSTDERGRPLQRLDRHVAGFRIEHAIDLGAAGVHLLRELVLAEAPLAHGLGELPGDDLLDR